MSRDRFFADGEVPLQPDSAEGDAETDQIDSSEEAPVDDNFDAGLDVSLSLDSAKGVLGTNQMGSIKEAAVDDIADASMVVPLPLDSAEGVAETGRMGSIKEAAVDGIADADMDVPLPLNSAEVDADTDGIRSSEEAPVDKNADASMDIPLPLDSAEGDAGIDQIRSGEEAAVDCRGNCESPSIQGAAEKEKSLHGAVKIGDLETVKFFLNGGTCVDARNEHGHTPLCCAIMENNLEIAEALLKFGADVNSKAREEDGYTPLHIASLIGCEEMTELLLSNGASVNSKVYYGCTPLHCAVRRNKFEVSKLLLEYGAEVSNTNKSGYTPLHDAISNHVNVELIKLLLNKEPRVDVEDFGMWSLFCYAVRQNNVEAAELLLEHGTKINNDDDGIFTPLHAACSYGSFAPYPMLHDYNVEMVKMLLRKGARLNVKDEFGRTPLLCAVKSDNLEAAESLLEWGADVNAGNDEYATPLDAARSHGLKLTLKRHVVKLKSANLFVSDENMRAVSQDDQMTYFQLDCEEEVKRLKEEHLCDGFSFYEVLTKNAGRLARAFARNDIIVRASKSGDFDTKFPIYGRIVNFRFLAFIERKELLGRAYKLFNFLPLPEVCIMEILVYLRNTDLKNL